MKQFLKEFWQTAAGKWSVAFLIPTIVLCGILVINAASMELGAIPVAIADIVLFLSALFCFFLVIPSKTILKASLAIFILLEMVVLLSYITGFSLGNNALVAAGNILCYIALPVWGIWVLACITKYIFKHPKLKSFLAICCAILLPIYFWIGFIGVAFLWLVAYKLAQTPRLKKILQIEAMVILVCMAAALLLSDKCMCYKYNFAPLVKLCWLGCRNFNVFFWELIVWPLIGFCLWLRTFLKNHSLSHYMWISYFILFGLPALLIIFMFM